jgi:hypothetical protein
MTDQTNSAIRIFNIVHQAITFPEGNSVLQGWAAIFHIDEPDSKRIPYAVADRLNQVYKELRRLEWALSHAPRIRPQLHQRVMAHLYNFFSPVHIPMAWPAVKASLPPEAFDLLETFQLAVPSEFHEGVISDTELSDIRSLIDDLNLALTMSDMSAPATALVQRQIDLMLRAIELYKIHGEASIREAQRTAMGDIIENGDLVKENASSKEVQEVANIWKRIGTACNIARGVDAAIRIGKEVWELIESAPTN